MRLFSPEIGLDGLLPERFTCDGEDVSPPLRWDGAPLEAHEFAISCVDPDAPRGEFVPWLVWGIEGYLEGIDAGYVPLHGHQGVNGFDRLGYGGACPPHGSPPHRYRFTLYA